MSHETEMTRAQAAEILTLYQTVFQSDDLPSKVLRLHALTEWYIERMLTIHLPAPQLIIEGGRFTYNQKLTIAMAMGRLPSEIYSALGRLTKLRNRCAHEMFPGIEESEILDAARPIEAQLMATLEDHRKDGLGHDLFHAYAWTVFSQLSLKIAPLEEAMGVGVWHEA